MRTILYIIQKEFRQIKHNRVMLPIIILMPIIQLLILVHAATYEMKHIRLYVSDADKSSISRQITGKFSGSPFYDIVDIQSHDRDNLNQLLENKADILINIPYGFEKKLRTEGKVSVQLLINGINAPAAALIFAYSSSIVSGYNKELITLWVNLPFAGTVMPTVNITYSYWFNPELNYKNFMVPGILVLLVTMIGAFMAGINIVREKEIGTIDQLNVSPVKKYQFIIGKLVPYWIIAMSELAFGLLIGKLLFGTPVIGNIFLLFAYAAIYLTAILGLGLLISTVNNTMQQSMFITWFFMVVFILMSGLFTPVESMPVWAQRIDIINPVADFIAVIRMILLKGSGFSDVKHHFLYITTYAVIIMTLAVRRYRKVS